MTYASPPTRLKRPDGKSGTGPLVIIGGGFAGLSAAVRLADRGIPVLVLEARGRLGGRATAFTDRETGETVDNGQHVMFGCYTETLAFLERIGASPNIRTPPALDIPFIHADGGRSRLHCPRWPPPLHLLAGILRWRAVPLADRLASLRLAPELLLTRARRRPPPKEQTVAEWLRAHGQTPALITALWEPLAVAALNQPIGEATAGPFITVLSRMFGPDPQASAVVLPAVPLDEMYARPARRFIEARGGIVRTDALARITSMDPSGVVVTVRGERIHAEAAIAAVPWHALKALLPDPPVSLADTIRAADAMRSMPIVTVNLWYDRPVMTDEFVGLTGRTIQWIFDKRRVFGAAASHLSLVTSAAGELAPLGREELIAMAAGEVAAALPGVHEARLLRGTVVREKQATFSLAHGQPARPGTVTPVPRLFLAGDWIDTGLPSTIESAVLSGHRAADAVLDRMQA